MKSNNLHDSHDHHAIVVHDNLRPQGADRSLPGISVIIPGSDGEPNFRDSDDVTVGKIDYSL